MEAPLKHCRGDLLDCDADFIAHQCNCVVKRGKGLAAAIFKRFPETDVYSERLENSTPGWNIIRGRVINMMGQFYPGAPRFENDSAYLRLRWFVECLEGLTTELPLKTEKRPIRLAFPWRVGCGLGGGSWSKYLGALKRFAQSNINVIQVEIYQLSEDDEPLPPPPPCSSNPKEKRQLQLAFDKNTKKLKLQ